MDVAMKFRENGFILQNMIHWIKPIALPKEDMGKFYAANVSEKGVAVGHYKPINSLRYHNDCHEFIFHFTKSGNVPIDRLANGDPYQDKRNVKRWVKKKQYHRDRGDTWVSPDETIRQARPHPAVFTSRRP